MLGRLQGVDLARLADAAQRVAAERSQAAVRAERRGEFGGHQHLAVESTAQRLDAGDFVDGRT
jgi:hypothetical protein